MASGSSGGARARKTAGITVISRRALHREFEETEELYQDTLRNLIVNKRRVDVLAKEVLGYKVEYHHLRMLQHQHAHGWSLVLLPRGFGKTLVCQVADSIMEILCDRDIRLIFGSRASTNACDSLETVKKHFERNEKLRALFGDLVNKDRWNKESIVVKGRTRIIREPTIVTISPDSAVSSKHGDIGYGDDFADETNSRTQVMRDHLETFFWKTFVPCLEPDVAQLRLTGTRYHPDDLYGALGAPDARGIPRQVQRGEDRGVLADATLVLPALYEGTDGVERSLWPDKFSEGYLGRLRTGRRVTFESQYQQNIVPMRGSGYVKYEDIKRFHKRDMPRGLPNYAGFDLAIGLREINDEFWGIVAAYDKDDGSIYFHSAKHGRFPFHRQLAIVINLCEEYDVAKACVESVAYQAAQLDEVKRARPLLPIFGHKPRVDKLARFERRSGLFEEGKIWVEHGLGDLVGQLVSFTGQKGRRDDAVDAFLYAIRAIVAGTRKRRKRAERLEALP